MENNKILEYTVEIAKAALGHEIYSSDTAPILHPELLSVFIEQVYNKLSELNKKS